MAFVQGNNWRIAGLQVYLIGAKNKVTTTDRPYVALSIKSSGSYVDTADYGICNFVRMPYEDSFRYYGSTWDGPEYDIEEHYKVDAGGFPADHDPDDDWSDPTPFSEWFVRVQNWGDDDSDVDLSGLTDVVRHFKGSARLDANALRVNPAQSDVIFD